MMSDADLVGRLFLGSAYRGACRNRGVRHRPYNHVWAYQRVSSLVHDPADPQARLALALVRRDYDVLENGVRHRVWRQLLLPRRKQEKILSRNVRPFTSAVLPELLGSAPDHDALDGGGYVDQQSGACLPFRRGRLLSLCLGDWPLCGRSKVHHAAATAHL